jgi:hypothetical protein
MDWLLFLDFLPTECAHDFAYGIILGNASNGNMYLFDTNGKMLNSPTPVTLFSCYPPDPPEYPDSNELPESLEPDISGYEGLRQRMRIPVMITMSQDEMISDLDLEISYDANSLEYSNVTTGVGISPETSFAVTENIQGKLTLKAEEILVPAGETGELLILEFQRRDISDDLGVSIEMKGKANSNSNLSSTDETFFVNLEMSDIVYEMNLEAGWSMISLPVEPVNAKLSELFPSAIVVYSFENGKGYMLVAKDEELQPGKGYWILLDQDQTFVLTGQPVHSYNLSIDEDGWAMIGGCTTGALPITDNCNIGVIYRYVKGAGYQRILETENLEPGKGYWILFADISDQSGLIVETVETRDSSNGKRARTGNSQTIRSNQNDTWELPIKATTQTNGNVSNIYIGIKEEALPDY